MCKEIVYSDIFLAETTVQTTIPTVQANLSARQRFITKCQPATASSKSDFVSYPKPDHFLAPLIVSLNTKNSSFIKRTA